MPIQSEVQYVVLDHAATPDNTIVAGVTGKKIRVVAVVLVAAAAVTARFESGTGGTALTGQMQLGINQALVWPYNPAGWFETAAAALLNLELSLGVSVDGVLGYVLVD